MAKTEATPATDKKDDAPAPPASGKGKLKVVLIVLAVLLIEGAVIGLTMFLAKGPNKAQATGLVADLEAEQNKIVELLVLKEHYNNQRTGRSYVYDTEIYVTIRKRDADKMNEQVEGMKAQLSYEVGTLFRRADPSILIEPELATLTRQIKAVFDDKLGRDQDGKPLVQDVFIRKCIGMRADI